MPHHRSWFETYLPPKEFWDEALDDEAEEDMLVLAINYALTDYKLVPDHRFRVMNLLIKNSILGGHKITIRILNHKREQLPFRAKFQMYKFIDCESNNQDNNKII